MNHCYHCGEPVPSGLSLTVNISNTSQPMCCVGCQAVAQVIVDNDLTQYYKFRTEPAQKSAELVPDELLRHQLLDNENLQSEFTHSIGDQKETILTIDGISCAACAWLIEMQISKLKGIVSINVNATSQRASITWLHSQLALSDILYAIDKIGYQALPFKANNAEENNHRQSKAFIRRLGVSGILMMQVMMIAFGLYFGAFSDMADHNLLYLRWTSLFLSLPIILYGAFPFYVGAYKALKAKRLSMDVPVSIAITLAYGASCWATISQQGEVYFESVAMFTFLLLIGKFLEFRARSHAAQMSANLLKLMPMTATKLVNGQEEFTAAKLLNIDDNVIIKPGETIPADGMIIAGHSQLNEAMLTGEQLPINKTVGDNTFAGTINGDSNIMIKVNKVITDSFLSQLIRLSESSQHYKPKLAQLSDKIAQYFIAIILCTAILSAIYWLNHEPDKAFWITISILVATCPCALSLATPTALTCATTKLNREGIMIKSGHVLETLPQIDSFAFDKTGTLTSGDFTIVKTLLIKSSDVHEHLHNEKEVLTIAAALESYSEHALAKAFKSHYSTAINATNVNVISGYGVEGSVNNKHYKIGKISWLLPSNCLNDYQDAQCALLENDQLIAIFYLQDVIREDALSTLNSLSTHYHLSLLSGDNQAGCDKVAQQLPLNEVHSNLSAKDKMVLIQQSDKYIAMVGDGVNDTPVFSAAHVSFAMGSGTDIAKNGADVILLNNQLSAIDGCIATAKKTTRIIWQNYAWAFGYNAIVLPLAVCGLITPYMAVIGMSTSSILVVTNSLRLLKSTSLK
jgi:Cu2+-exporting ATPase